VLLLCQSEPYLKYKDDESKGRVGNEQFEGYCADLAKAVCEKLGIEYELRLVGDGKYGEKNNNGTWNGMVGELTRKVRLIELLYHRVYSVSQKNPPLRFCGNFSKIVGNFSIKFYVPITRSYLRYTAQFCSITCNFDEVMPYY